MARGELNSDLVVTIELDGMGKFNSTLNQVESTSQKTGKQIDESLNKPLSKTPQQANNAGGALRSLNYVFQDSAVFAYGFQQGLMGIGNNIPMLVEGFQRMKQESGGTAGAFKALGAQLAGPMGIITGISLLVTAVTILPSLFKKSADEVNRMEQAFGKLAQVGEQYKGVVFDQESGSIALQGYRDKEYRITLQAKEAEKQYAETLAKTGVKYDYLQPLSNFYTKEQIEQSKVNQAAIKVLEEKITVFKAETDVRQSLIEAGGKTVESLEAEKRAREENLRALTEEVKQKGFLLEANKFMNIPGAGSITPFEFGAKKQPLQTGTQSPVPVEQVKTDNEEIVTSTENAAYRMSEAWKRSAQQIGQLNRNLAHGMVQAMRGASVSIEDILKDLFFGIVENYLAAGLGWLFDLALTGLGVPAPTVGVLSGGAMSIGGEMNSGGTAPQFQIKVITPSADATKVYFEKVNQDVLIPSTEKFRSQNTGGRNPYNKKT